MFELQRDKIRAKTQKKKIVSRKMISKNSIHFVSQYFKTFFFFMFYLASQYIFPLFLTRNNLSLDGMICSILERTLGF